MITYVGSVTYEYRGLSTDEKPIEYVGNGSVFFEMDTGKVFMFDESTKTWQDLGEGGGGGGGGGSADVVQDLTSIVACSLDASAWSTLKADHYTAYPNPVLSSLKPKYDFANIKVVINGENHFIKLIKNTTGKYSGLFFIEEGQSLYEITAYYNGSKLVFRSASVL